MFDPDTRTWSTFDGALDLASVHKLQTLFDAARTFGTEIRLDPVPMSADWQGPSSMADSEVAALLAARADRDRPLGHLSID